MNARSVLFSTFCLGALMVAATLPAFAEDTPAASPVTETAVVAPAPVAAPAAVSAPAPVHGVPASVPSTLFSFSAEEVPIKQALALFARANHLNIVPDLDIEGNVT